MAQDEGLVGRVLSRVDRLQQSLPPVALVVAVVKRYSEDKGGRQAALITFYGFLSVFPLLLLTVTFAALFFGESTLQKDIVHSALAQFPIIGDHLAQNIQAIAAGNSFAVTVAVLGLIWGSFGITNSLQSASAAVWRRPSSDDPSIWVRLGKGLELLGVVGSVCVLSTVVAGIAANGVERFGLGGNVGRALAFASVLLANGLGYIVALRLLSPKGTTWGAVAPGAALGAAGWTVLQVIGGLLIGQRLHHASQLYGLFAWVFGLIFWINLGAQLFLYATELNVVVGRREWPRSFRTAAP